ncbi:P-loop containing nucleoside triphosphate hydrolase protein [Halteromyces radiatus]|uniref:P-loop containing nucleoside triphosphate hydrolase protein n=1 Tax=Halteromyces radiatus TaxID=101107 RepID=UPI0022210191|nr:P-loop containing nucleoside triphosphate hydrolase protein [Halteromyces radiatus]KAI8089876.1 P-loop containing nucleoside triphosphate hydrolase protein [Halteromyces radiatus]
MTGTEYLQQLNEDQKEAVQSDSRSLQILAGPGSGKTRVLTTRVAWLVKEKDVRPSSIVVVTFTNKAAKEMKERLEQPTLLGFKRSAYLHMGTFHSFCAGILRRHIDLTPLERNFVIADAAKSKQLLTDIVKELEPHLQNKTGVKTQTASEYHLYISKAKSAGIDHHTYMAENRGHFLKKYTAMVYTAYEERLEAENMIDFDGLLLQGRNLLRDHPQVTDFVEHVLVDEFQDTNALQYELLQLLTRHGEKAFTVVGDPDQSIFGWRDADKAHFGKMEADYKDTVIVDLKENYRSTKFILQSASHVVEKDKARRPRHLFTNNHEGAPISLMKLETEVDEANAVAMEIKRILKYSNGLIGYKDIAVMFRMNFLTRNFEKAFTQAKIPYVLVSGTRFLDRMEVKDVLSYLSFFYNSRDSVAFTRLINAPKRGLGDVSIKKILICSRENGWTLLETLQRILDKHPATSHIRLLAKAREELNNLLKLQTEIQNKLNQKASIDIVLKHIVESISYFDYLKSNFEKDYESREANVKELIVFAQQHCEDLVDESAYH